MEMAVKDAQAEADAAVEAAAKAAELAAAEALSRRSAGRHSSWFFGSSGRPTAAQDSSSSSRRRENEAHESHECDDDGSIDGSIDGGIDGGSGSVGEGKDQGPGMDSQSSFHGSTQQSRCGGGRARPGSVGVGEEAASSRGDAARGAAAAAAANVFEVEARASAFGAQVRAAVDIAGTFLANLEGALRPPPAGRRGGLPWKGSGGLQCDLYASERAELYAAQRQFDVTERTMRQLGR